jgi:hypothetical protein
MVYPPKKDVLPNASEQTRFRREKQIMKRRFFDASRERSSSAPNAINHEQSHDRTGWPGGGLVSRTVESEKSRRLAQYPTVKSAEPKTPGVDLFGFPVLDSNYPQ